METYIVRETPYIVQFLYFGTVFTSHAEVTLSGNATMYLQGKIGNDRLIHFTSVDFNHNGTDVTFEIYENPTFTADGTTPISAINHNRESAMTAQFTTYSDPPTPTVAGTLITKDRIFGASGGVGQSVAAASLSSSGIEFLFKRGVDYALKVTNNTTASTTFLAHWEWFESGN